MIVQAMLSERCGSWGLNGEIYGKVCWKVKKRLGTKYKSSNGKYVKTVTSVNWLGASPLPFEIKMLRSVIIITQISESINCLRKPTPRTL